MSAAVEKLLALAGQEIGTVEDPPGSNRVKYNTAYYGRAVSGPEYAWCAVFVWWLFQKAGMGQLYYGGGKSAYVPALLSLARSRGETAKEPGRGDLVCFDFNGNGFADHIGLCEDFDGTYVTTIDGNTGTTNQANGGAVMRRRRHKRYIAGVIRPGYEEVEEMDQKQFDAMLEDYLRRLAGQEPSGWSEKARAWAEQRGIVSGDHRGEKQYKKFCTREELVQMLYNAQKE